MGHPFFAQDLLDAFDGQPIIMEKLFDPPAVRQPV